MIEIILGFLIVIAAIVLAATALTVVFAAVVVGAALLVIHVLPRLLLHTAILTLRGSCAAIFITLAALRELTGHVARGVAVWDGQPGWQQQAQERFRQEESVPQIDCWEAACKLLGLPEEGFDSSELSRAYRQAIVTAHPDVGGNPAMAKALNVARDLIRKQQGWG